MALQMHYFEWLIPSTYGATTVFSAEARARLAPIEQIKRVLTTCWTAYHFCTVCECTTTYTPVPEQCMKNLTSAFPVFAILLLIEFPACSGSNLCHVPSLSGIYVHLFLVLCGLKSVEARSKLRGSLSVVPYALTCERTMVLNVRTCCCIRCHCCSNRCRYVCQTHNNGQNSIPQNMINSVIAQYRNLCSTVSSKHWLCELRKIASHRFLDESSTIGLNLIVYWWW